MSSSPLDTSLLRTALLAVLAPILGGCYTLQAVSEPPEPGTDIRLLLNGDAAVRIGEMTGSLREELEGQLVEATSDSVKISVQRYRRQDQFDTRRELFQTFSLAHSEVAVMQERKLSTIRTLGFVGALGAVGGIIASSVSSDGGGAGPGPGDPNPPTQLVRIPLGILSW